jgi:hypothetical protein
MLPCEAFESWQKATIVKSLAAKFNRWAREDYLNLWNESVRNGKSFIERAFIIDRKREIAKILHIAKEGNLSKAMNRLNSFGLAPVNETFYNQLLDKHPQDMELPNFPTSLPDALKAKPSDVLEALSSFKKGTASGPDGLAIAHLVEAKRCGFGSTFIDSLIDFCNHILAARAPLSVAPYFAGANLFGLFKGDDRIDVRPIAVGNILRRLISKIAVKSVSYLADYFLPIQTGESLKNGTEATIHSIRLLCEKLSTQRDKVLLKVDAKNAFNVIYRKNMLSHNSKQSVLRWLNMLIGLTLFRLNYFLDPMLSIPHLAHSKAMPLRA